MQRFHKVEPVSKLRVNRVGSASARSQATHRQAATENFKIGSVYVRLICLLFFSAIPGSFGSEGAGETAKAKSTVHDFGELTEGESPKHVFRFENTTGQPLKIVKVRIPCGCAETEVSRKELEPGGSGSFSIALDTGGRRGKLKKNIYLLTDSKLIPLIKFTVKAEIKPKPAPICLAPSRVDAGSVPPKKEKRIVFEVENAGQLDLVLKHGTKASALKVGTEFPLALKPGKKKNIELVIKAPFYEGKVRANLMFETNDPQKPQLWILVICDVSKEAAEKE